ncbi:MAG: PAS domain S-box protein [Methylocella sp.]
MPHIKTELLDVAYEEGGPGQGAAPLLLRGSPGGVRAWPEPAESEARFRTLINSSPLPILVIDPDATVRFWNAAAEKLFGWTEAEVVGKAVPFVPGGRLPECISLRDNAMRGEIYSIETQRLRRDGSLVDVSISAAPLRDKHGEATEILILLNDATERKRAESLLAAEKRVLELIATGAPLPRVLNTLVHEVEANSNEGMLCSILLADDSGERLLHGAAPTLPETYNQAIEGARIGPNVGPCATAAYERRPVFVCDIASESRWTDFKNLAARHGLGACCSTPLLSSQGELLGTLAMYYRQPHDPGAHERQLIERATHLAAIVIERKRYEDALRQSRENLTAALAASDTGTFRWNLATGEFSECDENLKRLFGFAPDKPVCITQEFLDRVHPDDLPRLIPAADTSWRQGADFAMEYRVVLPDGKIRWLYDRAKAVRNGEGVPAEMVGACTDITERKNAEQALAAREREFRALADNMSQFAWMTVTALKQI